MRERTPRRPPSELVYVPNPSWAPVLAGAGLAVVAIGLFAGLVYAIVGGVIALAALWGWIRSTGNEIGRLPRRAAREHGGAAGGAAAPQRIDDSVARRRLGGGRLGLSLGRGHRRGRALGGPDAHDVAHREHADQLAAVDHDQVADVAPAPSPSPRARGSSRAPPRSACRSCDRRPARSRGPRPRPSEFRMSRSLIIRGPGYSSSITTAAPTPFSVIRLAASRRVCPGPSVSTTFDMPSRTSIERLPTRAECAY